jgi:Ni/Co efflux regulator RcnB
VQVGSEGTIKRVAELLKDRGRDGDKDRDRDRDRERDRDSSVEYDDPLTGGYRMYFIEVFIVNPLIFLISLSPSFFPHLPLLLFNLLIIPSILLSFYSREEDYTQFRYWSRHCERCRGSTHRHSERGKKRAKRDYGRSGKRAEMENGWG